MLKSCAIVHAMLTTLKVFSEFANFLLHFFIRTILLEHEVHFCSKFKNKLRTIQPQQKN